MANDVARVISLLSRELQVISPGLDGDFYAQPQVLEQLQRLAIARTRARLRFIVHADARPSASNLVLIELARRLPSYLAIRHLTRTQDEDKREVVIADERCLLLRDTPESRESKIVHGPAQARQAASKVDRLWEEASPAPEFRRLDISVLLSGPWADTRPAGLQALHAPVFAGRDA